jgi:hypothetical protein
LCAYYFWRLKRPKLLKLRVRNPKMTPFFAYNGKTRVLMSCMVLDIRYEGEINNRLNT